ncbi:MAG: hypothetical protein WAW37_15530, partial [Syntrophobacteraceae bacterium]
RRACQSDEIAVRVRGVAIAARIRRHGASIAAASRSHRGLGCLHFADLTGNLTRDASVRVCIPTREHGNEESWLC